VKKWIVKICVVLAVSALSVSYIINESFKKREASIKTEEASKNKILEDCTLKFVFPGDEPSAQQEVTKAVEEKLAKDGLNIKLDFTYIPLSQYWNKVALIASSGEDYDIIWTHISNISNLVSKKALAPVNEALYNYGKDILENTPDYVFKQITINGKIYGIPRVMPMAENQSFVQIRGDLRKKYNIQEIKNVEDIDKYFQVISRNEPDMKPYFYDPGRFLLREYGDVALLGGEFLEAPVYIDPEDEELKVKNTYQSDFFKNIIIKLREWQAKGYYTYSNYSEIPNPEKAFCEGKIAATWSVILKQTERIDLFKASTPEGELENVYLHPEKPKYMFSAADNILSVLSNSSHVNESIAFINWVRSNQENYDLFSYGKKDINYKLEGNAISYDGIAPEHNYMSINWAWNDIKYYRFSRYISEDYANTLKNWDKSSKYSPTLGFVPDLTPIKTEMAQLKAVNQQYLLELYDPKVDWDTTMIKFNKKLKDAGIDNVIKEIQRQFDEFRLGE
jgi:putative aldouronate transport system substrate-binding protein